MGGFKVFDIGDIPVRVSPWFFLLLVWWLQDNFVSGLIFAIVVTISILVHELGHALVARRYRLNPHILLHGLGGLCFHDRAERDKHDALIIAAGPGAGLVLGVISYALLKALPMLPITGRGFVLAYQVLQTSIYVNIIWSFVNLLPLWPLDGGQLYRLGLIQFLKPKTAEAITHWTAVVLLIAGLAFGLVTRSFFIGILCAYGLYQNYLAIKGRISSGTYRPTNKRARKMLEEAEDAYEREDYAEAARISHLLREEKNVEEKVTRKMWGVLGPSSARLGRHEEALSFLRKAEQDADVVEATIESLHVLGRDEELRELIESKDFEKIEKARREEILAVLEI